MKWLQERVGLEASTRFAGERRTHARAHRSETNYIARAWEKSVTPQPLPQRPATTGRNITPLSVVIGIIAAFYPQNAPLIPDEALNTLDHTCTEIIGQFLAKTPSGTATCSQYIADTLEL